MSNIHWSPETETEGKWMAPTHLVVPAKREATNRSPRPLRFPNPEIHLLPLPSHGGVGTDGLLQVRPPRPQGPPPPFPRLPLRPAHPPPPTPTPNPNPAAGAARFAPYKPRQFSKPAAGPDPAAPAEGEEAPQDGAKKKKKERATRPKLTPDLLLSDDGLGFVLRYFPKAFKPRARPGSEVEDLGNLIKLYADWHSRLIPYYSFDQFVRKAEKVGASSRVRNYRILEIILPFGVSFHAVTYGTTQEDPILGTEPPSTDNHEDVDPFAMESDDVDPMQEDLLNEIYEKTADEPVLRSGDGGAEQPVAPREAEKHQDGEDGGGSKPSKVELTEEQKARMEANRLKALERAAAARARASQSQPTTETTT
uniref:Chromosome segregation in meiosis protein 3 domain-containing protein n=1 Tax=Aegilops tauschii TaxID=37682 RepID=M8BCX4_AEGTA